MIGRLIDRVEEGAIAFLLLFMTTLTFAQVVLRYVFNSGFVWALETTTYAFIWMVLLGISYGVRHNAHIGVDVLVNLLPRGAKRAISLIGVAICLVYAALMLVGSIFLVQRLMLLGSNARDIPLPRWLLSSILPIGFLLFGWRLLEVGRAILEGTRDTLGVAHEDEADMSLMANNDAAPVPTPAQLESRP